MIKLIVKGDPIPKKNNSQIIYRGGRPMVIPSQASIKYEKEVIPQLKNQLEEDFKTIDFPVNVETVFYRRTKHLVDISNLINSIHDILSRAGVLEDDNWKIIESVDGSKIRFDKDNPRTEIIITKAEGETAVSCLKDIEDKEEELKRQKKRNKIEKKNKIIKKAYTLREQGLTFKEIGEEINYSASTANKYVKEYEKLFSKKTKN